MHSIDTRYIQDLKFSSSHIATLQAIGELKGKQELFIIQTPEALETLKTAAVIESTESSNRLEGIVAPHKKIEGLVLKSTEPENRSEQEIAGYRDALNLIHESGIEMEFSVNIILQMHSMICQYLPDNGGKWKLSDNKIVERNPDGSISRIRFTPVSAFETPQAMEKLTSSYKNNLDIPSANPLVLIPLTVFDFLCIHPFDEGNGRVSRLMTLLLLYHFGYKVGRYISLERLFEESKETYYETLAKSSEKWHERKHNCFPWLTYFWGVLLRAYSEFEQRVGNITTFRGSKTEQIKQAVMRKMSPFAISDITRECPGISRDMVRRVLRQMRDENLIKSHGLGRGAKWIKK